MLFIATVMQFSFDTNLNKIAAKIEAGERLTFDEGVRLFQTGDLNALGKLADTLNQEDPVQGRQLRLSIDLEVQRAAQEALATGTGKGAFAVMDVNTGEVLALGSEPSFDPNVFTRPLTERQFKALTSEELGNPLFNRAIQAGYPTGSTFKLVTATAALESGYLTPETVLNDPGVLRIGGEEFKNAGDAVFGPLALRRALTVSSDVFFYQLGRDMNERGMPLQAWARRLGIGRRTGIDLPEEAPGRLPTPRWRERWNEQGLGDGGGPVAERHHRHALAGQRAEPGRHVAVEGQLAEGSHEGGHQLVAEVGGQLLEAVGGDLRRRLAAGDRAP